MIDPRWRTERTENGTFRLTFFAPRQILLLEDFEGLAWNECLVRAHQEGVVPVGPVVVSYVAAEQRPLDPDRPLLEQSVPPDSVFVTAEVLIGVAL